MFGFRNFTGFSFVGNIEKVGLEFTVGIVEEISFNVTAAHAAEILENINVKLISKDQFVTSTSAIVSSKIAQTKLFDVIISATPNLLI